MYEFRPSKGAGAQVVSGLGPSPNIWEKWAKNGFSCITW